jgi:hypothetical protein
VAGRRLTETPTECAACHTDVHLGQLDRDCATCHAPGTATFAIARFDHDRASFPLTGAHETAACADCHEEEAGAFPAGSGTATRYTGLPKACRSCHEDEHLGQFDAAACDSCHGTSSFEVGTYTHKKRDASFFTGRHLTAECAGCHKPVERRFPLRAGRAVDFSTSRSCVSCHTDVHRGAMGNDCRACHRI